MSEDEATTVLSCVEPEQWCHDMMMINECSCSFWSPVDSSAAPVEQWSRYNIVSGMGDMNHKPPTTSGVSESVVRLSEPEQLWCDYIRVNCCVPWPWINDTLEWWPDTTMIHRWYWPWYSQHCCWWVSWSSPLIRTMNQHTMLGLWDSMDQVLTTDLDIVTSWFCMNNWCVWMLKCSIKLPVSVATD